MSRAVTFNGGTTLTNVRGLNSLSPTVAGSGILSLWYVAQILPCTIFYATTSTGARVLELSILGNGKLLFAMGNSPTNYAEFITATAIPLNQSFHSISVFFNFNRPAEDPASCIIMIDGVMAVTRKFLGNFKNPSGILYKNLTYHVGGKVDTNRYNGPMAEFWFSPFAEIVRPSTPSGSADGGAYLTARITGVGGTKWVAGNPGEDGNKLLLPYHAASRRAGAENGCPLIYLKGGVTEFPDNHSGPNAFQGSPLLSSAFTVVGSALSSSALEPQFGD